MSELSMKEKCAQEALKMISDGMVVGLGGGGTISILIELIKQDNRKVKVVSPSYKTAMLCKQAGLELLPTWSVESVDIAFEVARRENKKIIPLWYF